MKKVKVKKLFILYRSFSVMTTFTFIYIKYKTISKLMRWKFFKQKQKKK